MEILRSFRSYQFRKRLAGLPCNRCGLAIPWSLVHRHKLTSKNCDAVHDMGIDHWTYTETALASCKNPAEFRTLLLKNTRHFQDHQTTVLKYAFAAGEAWVATLFGIQRFTTIWRFPHRGHAYAAPKLYYDCIQRGWMKCVGILEHWPSVKATVPQLSYLRPILQSLPSLAAPTLRDELRKPQYAKMLKVYAAEHRHSLNPNMPLPSYMSIFRQGKGVAAGIREAQVHLLGFWTLQVRAKLRHWRQAHTFKPLPPFVPNMDALASLIERNPHRVPRAYAEFQQALATSRGESVGTLRRVESTWLAHMRTVDTAILHTFLKLAVRSKAWSYIAGDFLAFQMQHGTTLPLLKATLKSLKSVDLSEKEDMLPAVEHYLGQSRLLLGPKLVCLLLDAYHDFCRTSVDFRDLLQFFHVQKYIREPEIAKCIADLYMNRDMCISLARYWYVGSIMSTLWMSGPVQRMWKRIQQDAYAALRPFVAQCEAAVLRRRERTQQALRMHGTAWEMLVHRWRWVQYWRRTHTSCPICMEVGHTLVTLHGDRRHAICTGCLAGVQQTGNRCPMCRTHLTSVRTRTPSFASSISYTSDHNQEFYEDPDYDDDQMYHY